MLGVGESNKVHDQPKPHLESPSTMGESLGNENPGSPRDVTPTSENPVRALIRLRGNRL